MISAENKIRILNTLSIFETDTSHDNYGDVTVRKDGTDNSDNLFYQITYGRYEATEQTYLKELLTNYVANNGQFAEALSPYIPKIGNGALAQNEAFLNLLRQAGNEDSVMQETQDVFFDKRYYQPALEFFTVNGFTHPLSMLVIYDSYIHSGSIKDYLRKRFSELPPSKGGLEKAWVKAYVRVRHEWLSAHSNEIIRKTHYRTKAFMAEIERDNWDLSKPIPAQGLTSQGMPPLCN